MRVARWKVMAGGLLLSAGGLMAVADGPAPLPGCQPLPCLPAPTLSPLVPPPNTFTVRVKDAEPGVKIVRFAPPQPSATTVLVDPKSPHVTTKRMLYNPDTGKSVEVMDGDRFVVPLPQPTVPKPAESHTTVYPDPKTVDLPKSVQPAPANGFVAGWFGGSTLPATPAAVPPPAPSPMPDSGLVVAAPALGPLPVTLAPATEPAPPVAAPAPAVPTEKPLFAGAAKPEPVPATAEKRLKVVLQMGDDRPRFEVRDGDEVYLKVVSDRVEVKSAADKGDAPTMKAAGKVGFVTPGGDGTCDELAILPGSGQVVAVGNVSFRHTWGRSETTVTAERMTFRLAHPGPTAIQAGYSPVK